MSDIQDMRDFLAECDELIPDGGVAGDVAGDARDAFAGVPERIERLTQAVQVLALMANTSVDQLVAQGLLKEGDA